jgi:glycosyltransferase involved in cell wall biosynthesis
MSDHEKTLVILTPGFARDEADSTCIPMQQSFVKTLKENHPQLNVIILALEYPYSKGIYSWFGTTVLSFNGRNKGGLTRLLLRRKVAMTLEKIHTVNKITGLLSFWYGECALAGKKIADKHGIKHYCWMWGQDVKKENKYVRKGHLKAGELIAFSDLLQNEFEKNHGIKPLHVITPGISVKTFSFTNAKKDIDIMAAGSLIPLKQYDIFIKVIAEIKKNIPSISAVLIGDGVEKKRLQDLIEAAGLESNIILTGELPHPEVLQWMQRANLFLHPSSYEGFGIVCLEALCAGCKVISFIKPMSADIANWHIAGSKEEMIKTAIEILQKPKDEHKSIIPYTIEQSVQNMSQLFSF